MLEDHYGLLEDHNKRNARPDSANDCHCTNDEFHRQMEVHHADVGDYFRVVDYCFGAGAFGSYFLIHGKNQS